MSPDPVSSTAISWHDGAVAGDTVRLGDVADLGGLPASLRERAAGVIIFRGLRAGAAMTMSRSLAAARVRAAIPALGGRLASDGRVLRLRGLAVAAVKASGSVQCSEILRPVTRGAALSADDVADRPCGDPVIPAVRFDRETHTAVARRDLEPGTIVPRIGRSSLAAIKAGAHVVVHAQVGPVEVRREASAIRSAAAGRAIIVRTIDGDVFPVRAVDVE